MNRLVLATSALSAAVGLALAAAPAFSADMPKDGKKANLEKCYGINASGKNDCSVGSHSCAGQATMARDPKSFVLVPAGDCAKIAGGTTTAG